MSFNAMKARRTILDATNKCKQTSNRNEVTNAIIECSEAIEGITPNSKTAEHIAMLGVGLISESIKVLTDEEYKEFLEVAFKSNPEAYIKAALEEMTPAEIEELVQQIKETENKNGK